MTNEWKNHKWEDLATLEYGKSIRGYRENNGKYPVFGTNGIIGRCDEPLYDKPSVIIGRKGAYRGVHFSSTPFYVIDTAFYLKFKTDNINSLFAYYELLNHDINSMDSGSAIPSTSRPDFYNLDVKLPTLPEQNVIASILGALDDKIKLNHQMNEILEQIGQTIFRHWFIDFEFPDEEGKPYRSSGGEMVESELGEIPKGWKVEPLDRIAVFLNGLALQNYPPLDDKYLPVIKIKELRQGITESSDRASSNIPSEYIVKEGDILFSWSGSLEVVIWYGGKGALNQHLFKVTSSQYPKWFYYHWIKYHLPEFQHIAAGKATTMGHIQRHHLSEALVIIPKNEELSAMSKNMNPLLDLYVVNEVQSRILRDIRDSLLPKLMSGEIRVRVPKGANS